MDEALCFKIRPKWFMIPLDEKLVSSHNPKIICRGETLSDWLRTVEAYETEAYRNLW